MRLLVITQKVDKEDENLGSFHRWIEEFAKTATQITVIAQTTGNVSLPPHVEIFTFSCGDCRFRRLKKLFKFWELFSYHYSRSDAVFFHMIPEFVVAAAPFLISLKKPSVLWYVHKSVTWKLRVAEYLVGWVATASEMSFRLPSKKVIYTGHAIDTEVFRPVPSRISSPHGLRLLTIGRISPVKELETLIHGCAVLKERMPRPWSLSVVGGPLMPRDYEYLASLKKFVAEKGLSQYVHFQGSRPYTEIPELYREHDFFISMSTTGSVDKSVLEAMSSGLTVVTANEAFREILPVKYFLESRSPEFLAERIKLLCDEPRPNTALRDLVVTHHSLEKTIEKIITLFKTPI